MRFSGAVASLHHVRIFIFVIVCSWIQTAWECFWRVIVTRAILKYLQFTACEFFALSVTSLYNFCGLAGACVQDSESTVGRLLDIKEVSPKIAFLFSSQRLHAHNTHSKECNQRDVEFVSSNGTPYSFSIIAVL